MLADRGFSDAVFGFGAGIFYFGYLLFEIPSNLLLQRIGAAKTLARIALLWGLTSIAMMFVKTAMQFYVLRFMLGAFEAGLYPGVILYLTYWFPARHRAKMTGLFMTSIPAAGTSLPYCPHAASRESSRNGVCVSTRRSIRSRTRSLPRSRWRAVSAEPPPASASRWRARRVSSSVR